MKRNDMLALIKGTMRSKNQALLEYQAGDISAGRLLEILSEEVLELLISTNKLEPEDEYPNGKSGAV